MHRLVVGQRPGGQARAVHRDPLGRQRRQPGAGERAAELLEPGDEPRQVRRGVRDRHGQPPATRVAGRHVVRLLDGRNGGAPPGLVAVLAQELGAPPHPDSARRLVARELCQHVVRRLGPPGDLVLRERAVGVPERGRDRRGGLGRQVTGEHVRVVARLAEPDRAGQPDHSGADHDHAHGSQNSRERGVVGAAQAVVVERDAGDAAVAGQHARLRLDLLCGEDPAHRRQVRVAVEQVEVAGQLLDAVDLTASLDLDGHGRAVGVLGQDVDRADRGRELAPHQPPALAEGLDLLGEQHLQVRLHAVLDQARVDAELVRRVVQQLLDADEQLLAGLVGDRPEVAVHAQRARRAHPVQRLVGAVVGVHRDRPVGLDQDQPRGAREVGGEPADVVDRAPRDDQSHGRPRYLGDCSGSTEHSAEQSHPAVNPAVDRAGAPEMAREFTTVGVVGLGTMGAGIVEVFARNGLQVIGVEPTEESLERGRGHLAALDRPGGEARQAQRGRPARAARPGRVHDLDGGPRRRRAGHRGGARAARPQAGDLRGARQDLPARRRSSPPTRRRCR